MGAVEAPLGPVVSFVVSLAQIVGGIALFAAALPHRDRFGLRLAAAVGGVLVPIAALSALALWVGAPGAWQGVVVLALFALILAYAVWALPHVCEASPWASLFCCTAGYTVQNLASGADGLARLVAGEALAGPAGALLGTAATTALVYSLCWRLYARPARRMGLVEESERTMGWSFAFVVLAVIAFDVAGKSLPGYGVPLGTVVVLRLAHGAVCFFSLGSEVELLVNQQLRAQAATSERLAAERERQWELTQRNVEAINLKCHDIRHQIRSLEAGGAVVDKAVLDDIAREVSVYDSKVRTGNAALDTILSEKGLVCEREGITFTCIADGAALSFMAPADLYSLFGNAVENAIEATRQVSDPDRRAIGLDVRVMAGMARIHVENTFEGRVEFAGDGLPRSSKGDDANHGFGSRSMRAVAERYGGTLSVRAEGGVYQLNVVVPLPE